MFWFRFFLFQFVIQPFLDLCKNSVMSGVHFVFYSHAHLQKMSPRIRIVASNSGILTMETSDKNGYQLMEVAYHIDFDGCINLTTGRKEFVVESGFEDGDVVMVMFCMEDDSLTFRIYLL